MNTTATPVEIAQRLRTQQQEDGLRFNGARNVKTNVFGVTTGRLDGVDVIVSEFCPPIGRIDVTTADGSKFHGFEPIGAQNVIGDPATWVYSRHYTLYTRKNWTMADGNYYRHVISEWAYDPTTCEFTTLVSR